MRVERWMPVNRPSNNRLVKARATSGGQRSMLNTTRCETKCFGAATATRATDARACLRLVATARLLSASICRSGWWGLGPRMRLVFTEDVIQGAGVEAHGYPALLKGTYGNS